MCPLHSVHALSLQGSWLVSRHSSHATAVLAQKSPQSRLWERASRGPVGLKASPRRLPPGKEVPAHGLLMLTKLFSRKAKKLREPWTFGVGGRRRSSFSIISSILGCRRPVKAHTLNELFYSSCLMGGPAIQKQKERRETFILTRQLFLCDFLIKLIGIFYLQCLKVKRLTDINWALLEEGLLNIIHILTAVTEECSSNPTKGIGLTDV